MKNLPHHLKPKEFVATFPTGSYDIIARQLKRFSIDALTILEHNDNTVSIRTKLTPEKLIEMRFFTNVYMVLNESRLGQYKRYLKTESFRLFSFVNEVHTELNPDAKKRLSGLIERELGIKPNVSKFSHDFVVHRNNAGEPVLTLRLSRAKHKREDIRAGALRPELANVLLLTAAIHPNDILVDPFAGYGSIAIEAVRGFGVKKVIAVEGDLNMADQIQQRGVTVHIGDACSLDMLSIDEADKVVTNPPWSANEELYKKSFSEISRILKPQGVAVILSGNETLGTILRSVRGMSVIKSFPILVAGKGATVYKLLKS